MIETFLEQYDQDRGVVAFFTGGTHPTPEEQEEAIEQIQKQRIEERYAKDDTEEDEEVEEPDYSMDPTKPSDATKERDAVEILQQWAKEIAEMDPENIDVRVTKVVGKLGDLADVTLVAETGGEGTGRFKIEIEHVGVKEL